jgi:GntR family transcriptional regulator, transcriptional repressor for pyruvate dehydrogenase complex
MRNALGQGGVTQRSSIAGSLVALFKQLIAEGALSPGDRLPPERELAGMVGVSRSSLREGLKVLEMMGVISQRVGSGTRLNPAAASTLAEPLQFLLLLQDIKFDEVMEARLIVEPELAARAAERRTAEDLKALDGAIAMMEASADDPAQFVASDLDFHRAVYVASGNRVCSMLFSVVHQSLDELVRFTATLVEPGHTIGFHRRIQAAIRRQDAEGARRRMREHLEDAQALMSRGVAAQTRNTLEERLDGLRRPPS